MALGALDRIKAEQAAQGDFHPDDARAVSPITPVVTEQPKDLEHYQAAMDADLATLAGIKNLGEKVLAKQHMIRTYQPFVDDYVKRDHHYSNDIAVRLMIWYFDVVDIENGLRLALHLIKQGGQHMPRKFDRDMPTFVCDAVYDWANVQLQDEEPASPYLDDLVAVMEHDKWDLSPPVKSKLYAMLAKHKLRAGEPETAIALCDKAVEVNPDGAGVKTLKLTAQAALRKQSEPRASVSNFDPDHDPVVPPE